MPIYAYRCESCGYSKDVLQKISDAPLTDCPQCGAAAFRKQVTAAGFQLKGSGWYVTDFRNNNSGAPAAKPDGGKDTPASTDSGAAKPAESAAKSEGSKSESTTAAAPAAPAAGTTPSSGTS